MFGRKKMKTIQEMIVEKTKEEKIRKEISKTQEISENTKIVVEQKPKIVNFLLILIEIMKGISKIILIIIICILSTIGGTVLLNEALRNYFFSVINIPLINI